MNAAPSEPRPMRPAAVPAADGPVREIFVWQLLKAIGQRQRYKYVQPRIEREGAGWKIVSPNCSRNIDPEGGEIDIAWLVPVADGQWQLHGRDHVLKRWVLLLQAGQQDVIERLVQDERREFWQ
jgi:hypothetical protein